MVGSTDPLLGSRDVRRILFDRAIIETRCGFGPVSNLVSAFHL